MKSIVSSILVGQGILLLLLGLFIHYTPQTVMPLFHSNTGELQRETYTVMQGWGGSLIAIATTALLVSNLNTTSAQIACCRGFIVFWGLLGHGQFHMLRMSSYSEKAAVWRQSTGYILFVIEILLVLVNCYGGLLVKPSTIPPKKEN
eukprot:TRINITY_DN40506_c0_g1_i1.p1 TRINITY_DN40506_c0_g1~~TRINITY_DN40506_c0_g1_i1.p1  ORF type:complete len:147 (+),score=20.54 TRINITY_DN40506_c0_g1_i1:17-457(+)